MKESPEKLLADVLGDEELYASTLRTGLAVLRRKRRRRALQAAMIVLVPLAGLLAVVLPRSRPMPRALANHDEKTSAAKAGRFIEGTTIRVLSDEELLALFRDRPVALIGSPGHQQLVLFDEPVRRTEKPRVP